MSTSPHITPFTPLKTNITNNVPQSKKQNESVTSQSDVTNPSDKLEESTSNTTSNTASGCFTLENKPSNDSYKSNNTPSSYAKKQATNILSGTWGTAPYQFDSASGTLTIGAGNLQSVDSAPYKGDNPLIQPNNIKIIAFTGSVKAPESCRFLFGSAGANNIIKHLAYLEDIKGLSYLDTSDVTNMDGMFAYAGEESDNGLSQLDFKNFNTSHVKSMRMMFGGAIHLKELDLSTFDTSSVSNFSEMFWGITNLSSLNISNFNINTVNAPDMTNMFGNAQSDPGPTPNLKQLTLGTNFKFLENFDEGLLSPIVNSQYTGKWQNLGSGSPDLPNGQNIWSSSDFMKNYKGSKDADTYVWQPFVNGLWGTAPYQFDTGDGTLTVDSGDLQRVDDAPYKTGKLKKEFIKKIDFVGHVIAPVNSSDLFSTGEASYENLPNLSSFVGLNNLDVSNTENMHGMFHDLTKLEDLNLSTFNTSKVNDMGSMFNGSSALKTLNVSKFDTSQVTNMSHMFDNTSSVTSLNISNFDTSKVTNTSFMFNDMYKVTSLDISKFQTSNVRDMTNMFSGLLSVTSLDVSKLDTSNVDSMLNMFNGIKVTSLDVSNFDTSKVTNMSFMFVGVTNVTTLDVSNFDTSKVTNMFSMFDGAESLTSLDLSNFDTSMVKNMTFMFRDMKQLNTLILGSKSKFNSGVQLPEIQISDIYTGNWIKKDESTINMGDSNSFMQSYDGTQPGTYVWETRKVNIQSIDPISFGTQTIKQKNSAITNSSIIIEDTLSQTSNQGWELMVHYDMTDTQTKQWLNSNLELSFSPHSDQVFLHLPATLTVGVENQLVAELPDESKKETQLSQKIELNPKLQVSGKIKVGTYRAQLLWDMEAIPSQ